ncbi:MAG: GtrA family protein, partial [Thermoplasmatota archaeon]
RIRPRRVKDATIILPTLEEEETIGSLVAALAARYPGVRILVADDDSPDATRERARAAAPDAVVVLHRRGKARGLTASVVDAVATCETPMFVVMDADLQHDPAVAGRLAAAVANGAALAIGTRATRTGLSPLRRVASRGSTAWTRAYLRARPASQPVADPLSGYFAMRTDLARQILAEHRDEFEAPGFKVLLDFLKFLPADARIAEVEYAFQERGGGFSKASFRTFVHLARQLGSPGRALAFMLSRAGWVRIARWGAVGATGIVVNEALLFAFHGLLAWPLFAASAVATECAIASNFALHETWTWRDRRTGSFVARAGRFQLVSLGALVLTVAIVAGLSALGIHYLVGNLVGIAFGSVVNFIANDRWTWR